MDRSVRWFLRGAVLWLLVGLALGIWMGFQPGRVPFLRASHLHALLPGFVLFMIFGVGYHVLPRFSGRPVPWPRGPMVHLVLAGIGVTCLVAGFPARVAWPAAGGLLLPLGGVLYLAGALLFAHAAWTLTGAPSWQQRTSGGGAPKPLSPPSPSSPRSPPTPGPKRPEKGLDPSPRTTP